MPTPRVTIDELPEQTAIESANLIIVQDAGVTKKMTMSTLTTGVGADAITEHIADTIDAHAASAISAADSGNGVDGPTVQAQLGQLASGLGSGGGDDLVISDTPPEDTSVLWADTATEGVAPSQTVSVFTYTDAADTRPEATVVFWIPDPYTLDNPIGALVGDLVLRTTPDVITSVTGVTNLEHYTVTEYDAIASPDPDTVYIIVADP